MKCEGYFHLFPSTMFLILSTIYQQRKYQNKSWVFLLFSSTFVWYATDVSKVKDQNKELVFLLFSSTPFLQYIFCRQQAEYQK